MTSNVDTCQNIENAATLEAQRRAGAAAMTRGARGVLDHESDLDIEEHYTDPHGYTEINFAAFVMVGMRFCPAGWVFGAVRGRPFAPGGSRTASPPSSPIR